LSPSLIAELFESVGIVLTDAEAQECLDSLQPNQVNRFALQDVVTWWVKRPFLTTSATDLPAWRRFARSVASAARVGSTRARSWLRKLRIHHSGLREARGLSSSKRGVTVSEDPLQQHGSPYLSNWQRARSHLPPSRWLLLATFGEGGEKLPERDAPLKIDFEWLCFPKEQNPAFPLTGWHVTALSDLNAGRLLEKHPAGSVIWFVFHIKGADEPQLRLLGSTVRDMFV
jgi:hypothetical protein